MTGYITTGEIGNTALEAEGTDAIPSTGGEVAAATFGNVLASGPTPRLWRFVQRNTVANPRTMQPDELNEMFSIPGKLTFDTPTTIEAARDLHDFHRAEAVREDVIRRSGGGVGSGLAARFGVGLVATLLDPINVASAFIPGIREERAAALLGEAAAGVVGRVGVRAITGGSSGFLGAAAVEPLNYWLSQQDKDDYTMGDALAALALGTVAGSVLHSGLGVIRDARRGLPDWSPESHRAALTQTTAAIVEGRPVAAAEAAEFTAVRQARQELDTWYGKLAEADRRAADASADYGNRTQVMAQAADNLRLLRTEAEQLARERRAVEIDNAGRGLNLPQRRELDAINAKLEDPSLPLSERLTLEIQRLDLIDEGTGRGPRPSQDLEVARGEAQVQGIERIEGRLRSKAGLAEANLRRAQQKVLEADAALKQARSIAASREATVLALADKTVRRLAYAAGVNLEPGRSMELASLFIRTASGPEGIDGAAARLQAELLAAGKGGPGVDVGGLRVSPDEEIMARTLRGLTEREVRAETVLRDSLRPTEDAADILAARTTAAEVERAPKVEGTLDDEIAAATDDVKRIEDTLMAEQRFAEQQAKARGEEPPAPDRGVEYADELRKDADSLAKAYEAAAVCAIGRA